MVERLLDSERRLDAAQTIYEGGEPVRAAQILAAERTDAVGRGRSEDVVEIDELVEGMRVHLSGQELTQFDRIIGGKAPATEAAEVVDVSPAGLVLASLGALAMLIAVFLPYADSSSAGFAIIEKNTLIQNGAGWWFIVLALIGGIRVYASYRSKKKTWAPVITGGLAIAYAVYFGSNGGDSLRLCSVATGTNCPGRQSRDGRVPSRRRRLADGRRGSRDPRLEEDDPPHRCREHHHHNLDGRSRRLSPNEGLPRVR